MENRPVTREPLEALSILVGDAAGKAIAEQGLSFVDIAELLRTRKTDLEAILVVSLGRTFRTLATKFSPELYFGPGWSFAADKELPSAPIDINPETIDFNKRICNANDQALSHSHRQNGGRLCQYGKVHLGPDHFLRFWEIRSLLSDRWKAKKWLLFDAKELRSPDGHRVVVGMHYYDGHFGGSPFWEWRLNYYNDRGIIVGHLSNSSELPLKEPIGALNWPPGIIRIIRG